MSLRVRVRVYLGAIPGASVRAMAVALGEPPAAIQGACWAEGLEVPGLPDLQAILEPICALGQTTMFEVRRPDQDPRGGDPRGLREGGVADTGQSLSRLHRHAASHTQAEAARIVGISRQRVAREHGLGFQGSGPAPRAPGPVCHSCGRSHDGAYSQCEACREAERDRERRDAWRAPGDVRDVDVSWNLGISSADLAYQDSAGADLSAQHRLPGTALHVAAAFNENPDMIRILAAARKLTWRRWVSGCSGRPKPQSASSCSRRTSPPTPDSRPDQAGARGEAPV